MKIKIHHTVQTCNSCTSRLNVCQCLVLQAHIGNMSKNRPSASMTHAVCELTPRPFVRSSMHPCPGNVVATGRVVVCYAQAVSAGIKCRHCTYVRVYNELDAKIFSHKRIISPQRKTGCLQWNISALFVKDISLVRDTLSLVMERAHPLMIKLLLMRPIL